MKQFFTLLSLAVLASPASAQLIENFNGGISSLTPNCWTFNTASNVTAATTTATPISGTSIGTNPLGMSEISTPLLNINASATVTFKYKLNNDLNGLATRTIEIGTTTNTGTFMALASIVLDKNSPTSVTNFAITNLPVAVLRRVTVRVTGSTGSGQVYVVIDDLDVQNASFSYSGGCPPAAEAIILPLKLLSFQGSLSNNKAQLKWSVAENETGDHFEVEKSLDGRNFSSIATVFTTSKAGTDNYTFNEASELSGTGYYRLKMVNKNGSVSQSKIIVLKNEKVSTGNSLVIAKTAGASVTFNYASSKTGLYSVNVYNVNGAKLIATGINMQKGSNAASINVDGMVSSGVYVLEVVNGADRSITKFLK